MLAIRTAASLRPTTGHLHRGWAGLDRRQRLLNRVRRVAAVPAERLDQPARLGVALLQGGRESEYASVDLYAVGELLEKMKAERANLQRWSDSGEPRRWVEARQGAWGHDDWVSLIDRLQQSEYGPLQPEAVGAILEGLKAERSGPHPNPASVQAELEIAAPQYPWSQADCLCLLDALAPSLLGLGEDFPAPLFIRAA